MRNAYKPVNPSAPVPTILHDIQSLYSRGFPSLGAQVGESDEGAGADDDIDARGGPDILVRAESNGSVKIAVRTMAAESSLQGTKSCRTDIYIRLSLTHR